MRRVGLFVVTVALCAATPASAAWEVTGGPSPINLAGEQAGDPSLALVNGIPHVAWYETDGTGAEIRVARLNSSGAWERVGEVDNPASPINHQPTRFAREPSLTSIGGIPYVAWSEPDSVSGKIRVARLNTAGTGWEKVGQTLKPSFPINQSAGGEAGAPSLTSIEGVPYVAWSEYDGTNTEIRVARLNADQTGWDKVGQTDDPASPINRSPTMNAGAPSLTSIDGVPYVAWTESDGTNSEIRAARLNAARTGWEPVGEADNPLSPINQAPDRESFDPDLIVIDGVPYVAWAERDETSREVRVARLSASGRSWEKVGQAEDPESPVNASSEGLGTGPDLDVVDGVPYVVWVEGDDDLAGHIWVARLGAAGAGWELVAGEASPLPARSSLIFQPPSLAVLNGVPYVAASQPADPDGEQLSVTRLEPEPLGVTASAGSSSATLSASWRTYGIAFPIGFDYGNSLELSTTPTLAPSGVDSPTVSQQVSGLAPQTAYQLRSYALPGTERRVLSEVTGFTTTQAPDTTPPETTITKEPKAKSAKSKAKYGFTSSEPNSTFVCKFDKRKPKPCDSGKVKFKRLDDGKHKFRVYAVDAAGNQDATPAKDKFKVL